MGRIIRRDILDEIKKWIKNKEIIAIRGPRQSGKTTLLGQIKKDLLKNKDVHYISFEDNFEKEKFEKNPKDYVSYMTEGQKFSYLFFDEVQYIRDAGKLLKLVYDSFKDIKIIVTGSSTLDLNELGSYLVGRVLLFELYPFSFNEFLAARDERLRKFYEKNKISLADEKAQKKSLIFLDNLNKLLKEYLTYGGYPAVVLEEEIDKKKFLLKNLVQTYIEKDIVKLYGLKYKQKIIDLVRYLSSLNGAMVNYNDICSSVSLYDKELKEIISILEQTYVIKAIRPFHKNLTTELRKNPKIYFIDTGLRNIMVDRFVFNDDEQGILLENCLLKRLISCKLNYWRTTAKAEVDFVVDESIPIESKSNIKITKSFRSFIKSYNPKKAFIINLNTLDEKMIDRTKVMIAPFVLFL